MTPRAVCWLHHRFEAGKISFLAVGRRDGSGWGLPGGKIEPGETPEAALKREVLEETGFQVEGIRLLFRGLCSGDVEHDVEVFAADPVAQGLPSETLPVSWISRDEMLQGPFGEFHERLFTHLEKPKRYTPYGALIRSKRLEKGLSLRKAAELLGVSHTFFADVETGRRRCFASSRELQLVDILGNVSVAELEAVRDPEKIMIATEGLSPICEGLVRKLAEIVQEASGDEVRLRSLLEAANNSSSRCATK